MTGEKSTGATDLVIESRALTKEFRRGRSGRRGRTDSVLRAVDSLTVTIRPGEAVGYIGANGAGKSTTIKMITGILKPSTGSVLTCGLDPMRHRRDLARRIGVVFGQRSQLWWDLPLQESLRILGAIHALPPTRWQRRRDQLVERLDLAAFLDRPVRRLSLGERMRGELAAALLHEPELLILDEPANGLDPAGVVEIRDLLASLARDQGVTVFMSSHILTEVDRLATRIGIIHQGRLIEELDAGKLETLRSSCLEVRARDLEAVRIRRSSICTFGTVLDLIESSISGGRVNDAFQQRVTRLDRGAAKSKSAPVSF